MKTISLNPDIIGIIAGTLCSIHCIATPFLFLAKACSTTCCADAPIWWQFIDYIFIVISFVAIYFATKNSNKRWMQVALWGTWVALLFAIFSETIQMNVLPTKFIYVPAISMIGLHVYNQKYCKCTGNECCIK